MQLLRTKKHFFFNKWLPTIFSCGFENVLINALHILKFTEADYTLDDSFWNEESPVGMKNLHILAKLALFKRFLVFFCIGEVERLLKEYRQNQELVRKIGGHFYQIIYPVQLRHHEKMGISTREVGGSKVRFSLGRRNIMNSTVCQFIHSFIYSYNSH